MYTVWLKEMHQPAAQMVGNLYLQDQGSLHKLKKVKLQLTEKH